MAMCQFLALALLLLLPLLSPPKHVRGVACDRCRSSKSRQSRRQIGDDTMPVADGRIDDKLRAALNASFIESFAKVILTSMHLNELPSTAVSPSPYESARRQLLANYGAAPPAAAIKYEQNTPKRDYPDSDTIQIKGRLCTM